MSQVSPQKLPRIARFCDIHLLPLFLVEDLLTGEEDWACLSCDLENRNSGDKSLVRHKTEIRLKKKAVILEFKYSKRAQFSRPVIKNKRMDIAGSTLILLKLPLPMNRQ